MKEVAFEYVVRTRQMTDETYLIEVEKAPGHWIAVVRLPDGSVWNMDRFDPRAPALPKQWVGGTAAAAPVPGDRRPPRSSPSRRTGRTSQ